LVACWKIRIYSNIKCFFVKGMKRFIIKICTVFKKRYGSIWRKADFDERSKRERVGGQKCKLIIEYLSLRLDCICLNLREGNGLHCSRRDLQPSEVVAPAQYNFRCIAINYHSKCTCKDWYRWVCHGHCDTHAAPHSDVLSESYSKIKII